MSSSKSWDGWEEEEKVGEGRPSIFSYFPFPLSDHTPRKASLFPFFSPHRHSPPGKPLLDCYHLILQWPSDSSIRRARVLGLRHYVSFLVVCGSLHGLLVFSFFFSMKFELWSKFFRFSTVFRRRRFVACSRSWISIFASLVLGLILVLQFVF